MQPYPSASGSVISLGDAPNVQSSAGTAYVYPVTPILVFFGVSNPSAKGGTAPILNQTLHEEVPSNQGAQTMTADDRPFVMSGGGSPATGMMPWSVCQPQALTSLQDSEIRPAGMLQSLDDCPSNSRSTTNPMVWDGRPIARSGGAGPMSGMMSWPVCQQQASNGFQDLDVRPAGMVRSSDDCPINSQATTNQLVWGGRPITSSGGDSPNTDMMPWASVSQQEVSKCLQDSDVRSAGMVHSSNDCPINSQTNLMAWPVRQPQVSNGFRASEVRPVGMVRNPDDCPISINSRTMTNQVVWGSLEASSTDFPSSGSQSSDTLTLSSSASESSMEGRRGPRKIINKRIDSKDVFWRSPSTSAKGTSSGSNASDDAGWPAFDECDMSPTTPSAASGTSFGEYAYAPDPPGINSDSESDDGKEVTKEHMHAGQSQTKSGLQDMSLEQLLELVPCNKSGFPTSIGSIGHSGRTCKPPCVSFSSKSGGCARGVMCSFCHLAHVGKKHRPRPDKGMRGRYRKHWERFKSQIEDNPDTFDMDTVTLPPSISSDAKLKEKLTTRMRKHQEYVKAHSSEQPARRSTVVSL